MAFPMIFHVAGAKNLWILALTIDLQWTVIMILMACLMPNCNLSLAHIHNFVWCSSMIKKFDQGFLFNLNISSLVSIMTSSSVANYQRVTGYSGQKLLICGSWVIFNMCTTYMLIWILVKKIVAKSLNFYFSITKVQNHLHTFLSLVSCSSRQIWSIWWNP